MKSVGFIVFVLGVIVSISAAAKLPNPDTDAGLAARFPDTMVIFTGGLVAAAAGLGLWWSEVLKERAVAREAATERTGGDEVTMNPEELLERLLEQLTQVDADLESLDEVGLMERISNVIDDFVNPLAEARHQVVNRFGLADGSEVLNATAFGERLLNRVWSAAADGHLPEAGTSFREAITAFRQARDTMQRFEQTSAL